MNAVAAQGASPPAVPAAQLRPAAGPHLPQAAAGRWVPAWPPRVVWIRPPQGGAAVRFADGSPRSATECLAGA